MSDICNNVVITESPIILYKFRMCMIINICKNANIHKIKNKEKYKYYGRMETD